LFFEQQVKGYHVYLCSLFFKKIQPLKKYALFGRTKNQVKIAQFSIKSQDRLRGPDLIIDGRGTGIKNRLIFAEKKATLFRLYFVQQSLRITDGT